MVLHYLGLDHIGHLAGPSSDLVPPKLEEMSEVIRRIHAGLKVKVRPGEPAPMMLILGDHGMSDAGSHGGASVSEVMTPFVFVDLSNDLEDGAAKKVGLCEIINLSTCPRPIVILI